MPELHESLLNPFKDWDSWSQTPLGARLLSEEQAWLDATLSDVFGYHAMQIGPMPLDALRSNRMSTRARMGWPGAVSMTGLGAEEADQIAQPSYLVGSLPELPFQTESLDLLVLSHALEVCEDPHHLLREAQRALIPEGKLVVVGFNPFSLWRLRKRTRSINRFPPAGHRWISLPRIKDWLKLLNFDLGAGGASAFGGFVPPVESEKWLSRLKWMDPAGRRWWPMAGGVYFLMAVKRVHHMQLIGPNWRERKQLAASRAAAAPKTVHSCPSSTPLHPKS
jgi:SAM-dependent methyltransferase